MIVAPASEINPDDIDCSQCQCSVRKGGLPPLVAWLSTFGGGKPAFLTEHILELLYFSPVELTLQIQVQDIVSSDYPYNTAVLFH